MNYQAIITDICSQLGDPNKDTYEERAKDHFVRAIFSLIDQKKYNIQDIPGYIKYKTDLTFTDEEFDLTSLPCYKIEEIFMPPDTISDLTVSIIDINQLRIAASNEQFRPTDNEIFLYRIGNTLYLFTSSSTNYSGEELAMIYMEDIDPSTWEDTTDLTDGKFSQSFVRRAITVAVQTLRQEDSETK